MQAAKAQTQATALTLGNFDGVHRGHDQVLTRLKVLAAERGMKPLAITFEPHPRHLFRPDDRYSRLTSPSEKKALLEAYGIEVVTVAFDMHLAQVSAETFITDFLVGQLQGQAFLLGHDHRFGAGAKGNAALVRSLLPKAYVEETEPFQLEGETVSSSLIRQDLEMGRPETAAKRMGRPFLYVGEVVHGAGRARTLQVPTANIRTDCPEKVQVKPGVYFGLAQALSGQHAGQAWPALANIGFAPTFGAGQHKIEVHVPGENLNLYGDRMRFEVQHLHRPERSFDDLSALKTQIDADLDAFRAFLATHSGSIPKWNS
jgi:riboflavin kinase / FMN adenylyltransferase